MITMNRSCWSLPEHVTRAFVWLAVFFILVGATYLVSRQNETSTQVVINYYRTAALLATMLLVFQPKPVAQRAAVALLMVVIFASIMNLVDFFLLDIGFSRTGTRAAGLYVNPNISGKLLVFGMTLSHSVLPRWLRFPFCLAVGIAVVLTFSRSSMLLWCIAVLALSWWGVFVQPRLQSFAMMLGLILALAISLDVGHWLRAFEMIGSGDLLTEVTTSRIGQSFATQEDPSLHARLILAKEGWRLFLEAPVLGHGIGAIRHGVHNMYLQIGVEHGIAGLGLIIWLISILWRQGGVEGRTLAIIYSVSGFFTNNNFNQPAVQIILALAIVGVSESKLKVQLRTKFQHRRHRPLSFKRVT